MNKKIIVLFLLCGVTLFTHSVASAQFFDFEASGLIAYRYNSTRDGDKEKTDFLAGEIQGVHVAILHKIPIIPSPGATVLKFKDTDENNAFKTETVIKTVNTVFPVPILDSLISKIVFLRIGIGVGVLDAHSTVTINKESSSFNESAIVGETILKLGYTFGKHFGVHIDAHRFFTGDIHDKTGKTKNLSGVAAGLGVQFLL